MLELLELLELLVLDSKLKKFFTLLFCSIHISCLYVRTYVNSMVSQALQVCRGDNTSTTGMTDLVRLVRLVRHWYDTGTTGHDSRFKVEKIFAISYWFSIGLMLVICTSCLYVRVYVYILFLNFTRREDVASCAVVYWIVMVGEIC